MCVHRAALKPLPCFLYDTPAEGRQKASKNQASKNQLCGK